ncbi:MAG: class I mannose-6-phosphate isomerase [Phycisphaeraceae bacterium]|nr:class I mannose-6-phosphate isomerase [Phycisphaeraceae bacterium]
MIFVAFAGLPLSLRRALKHVALLNAELLRMRCYPLVFRPIFKDKVWGGRALETLGKKLPPGNIGESWELVDLDSTSASGGGGSAEHSVIENGALAGKPIREAIRQWGPELLGETNLSPAGAFPLLVKFLDAREHLSIQVHPSPDYAAANRDCHLKTECWYVLATSKVNGQEPVIFKGLKPGVTRADLEAAVNNETVPDVMQSYPAIVGECHNLPSGTIHALGAGVVVAEVQTPSDTTFRVYDWAKEYGRKGRELHIGQTLACTDFGAPPPVARLDADQNKARLVTTDYFRLDEWRLRAGETACLSGRPNRAHVVMMLRGAASLNTGASQSLEIEAGRTILIPASLTNSSSIVAAADSTLLVVDVT